MADHDLSPEDAFWTNPPPDWGDVYEKNPALDEIDAAFRRWNGDVRKARPLVRRIEKDGMLPCGQAWDYLLWRGLTTEFFPQVHLRHMAMKWLIGSISTFWRQCNLPVLDPGGDGDRGIGCLAAYLGGRVAWAPCSEQRRRLERRLKAMRAADAKGEPWPEWDGDPEDGAMQVATLNLLEGSRAILMRARPNISGMWPYAAYRCCLGIGWAAWSIHLRRIGAGRPREQVLAAHRIRCASHAEGFAAGMLLQMRILHHARRRLMREILKPTNREN